MIKKSKYAQTAIEFMILIGFVLFFFTVFFLAIGGNMSGKLREKKNLDIKDIALTVQDEINLALQSSDGYSRNFTLPEKIGNEDYDIDIVEDMVYVRTVDNKYAIALPVMNVTGNIRKNVNTIKKENGRILLNQ